MNHAESSPLTVNGIGPTAVKSPLFVELYNNWICFFFGVLLAAGFLIGYLFFIVHCTVYILT